MEQTLLEEGYRIIRKLLYEYDELSAEEVTTLLWVMEQDGPDAQQKAIFAFLFTIDIDRSIYELQKKVQEDSRKNPTFNARLLPLYDQFFGSLQQSRTNLFYQVCTTILQDSWICSFMDDEIPDILPIRQSEVDLFDDDF